MKLNFSLRVISVFFAAAVSLSVTADDAPHWIGLDTSLRTADVTAVAAGDSLTALDTVIFSREVSPSRAVTGRPFIGLILQLR